MADDLVAAALAEIRADLESAALAFPEQGIDPARASFAAGTLHGNALKALAGLEAALRFHQPVPLYGNAATEDEPGACPHDPDAECHFESGDGEWLCGLSREGTTCSGCGSSPDGEYAPWPCPEHGEILAAVAGKGEEDGR